MQYLILIYGNEENDAKMTPEQNGELFAAYGKYTADLKEAGVYVGGEALEATTTATTIRVRDQKTLTIDGPFAETKEALGGFYLLDCKDLDEALKWGAQCPHATIGSIEVRPIMKVG